MFRKSEHALLNISGIIFINQEKIKYVIKESRRKFERNAFQTFYSGKSSIIRASLDKPNSFFINLPLTQPHSFFQNYSNPYLFLHFGWMLISPVSLLFQI